MYNAKEEDPKKLQVVKEDPNLITVFVCFLRSGLRFTRYDTNNVGLAFIEEIKKHNPNFKPTKVQQRERDKIYTVNAYPKEFEQLIMSLIEEYRKKNNLEYRLKKTSGPRGRGGFNRGTGAGRPGGYQQGRNPRPGQGTGYSGPRRDGQSGGYGRPRDVDGNRSGGYRPRESDGNRDGGYRPRRDYGDQQGGYNRPRGYGNDNRGSGGYGNDGNRRYNDDNRGNSRYGDDNRGNSRYGDDNRGNSRYGSDQRGYGNANRGSGYGSGGDNRRYGSDKGYGSSRGYGNDNRGGYGRDNRGGNYSEGGYKPYRNFDQDQNRDGNRPKQNDEDSNENRKPRIPRKDPDK